MNRALAGDRLLFLTLQTIDTDDPQPDDLKRIGTIAAIRQMAKVPNGGIHVIVEGLLRGRAELMTRTGQRAAGDGARRRRKMPNGTLEVDAYVRRLHELIDRALSVSQRPLAGTADDGRPASTTRCGWPTCCPACST